jgi:hypothetical protein
MVALGCIKFYTAWTVFGVTLWLVVEEIVAVHAFLSGAPEACCNICLRTF